MATNKIGRKHTQRPYIIGPLGELTGFVSQTGRETTFPAASADNALTANSGGGQANAVQLNYHITRVTTVGAGGDSVKLPKALVGMQMVVINAAASNSMNVFPSSGEQINALGNDTAFAVAANKAAWFICALNGQWHSVLTA